MQETPLHNTLSLGNDCKNRKQDNKKNDNLKRHPNGIGELSLIK